MCRIVTPEKSLRTNLINFKFVLKKTAPTCVQHWPWGDWIRLQSLKWTSDKVGLNSEIWKFSKFNLVIVRDGQINSKIGITPLILIIETQAGLMAPLGGAKLILSILAALGSLVSRWKYFSNFSLNRSKKWFHYFFIPRWPQFVVNRKMNYRLSSSAL